MTPDQIRQIAEEYAYAHNSNPNPPYCPEGELTKRLTEAFIAGAQYIAERYCVVEREEVFRLHNNAKMLEWDSNRDFNIIGHAAIKTLEELFGSETFNKNEDD